jgi:hypothetical protein
VLVTVFAVWLGWELSYIRERRAWTRENQALLDAPPLEDVRIPAWRVWLGDEPVAGLVILDNWTDDEWRRVKYLFPEAFGSRRAETATGESFNPIGELWELDNRPPRAAK